MYISINLYLSIIYISISEIMKKHFKGHKRKIYISINLYINIYWPMLLNLYLNGIQGKLPENIATFEYADTTNTYSNLVNGL